ncbi:MAG: 1-acyl-sn-glycerol-3-phosphate acyltransferase [Bacteroidota bacterium]
MIFNFLRFFVELAFKFYFRTIYFLNEASIPDGQPIIVAGNHSNSALDAMIIDAFLKKNKLYWLARGDIFNNKWLGKFMTAVRTAPIYRASEVGFVDIKRNNDSFNLCFDLLNQNRMVGIFPEGVTVHERKLQTPFKKGFARLAFQAHEKLGRPIMVLPVGVSYHSLTQTRTDVFVKFGAVFSTELFYNDYKTNQANALKNITQYLETQLNDNIINYDEVKDQNGLNLALNANDALMRQNKPRVFGLSTDENYFNNELKIVNYFIDKQRDKKKIDVKFESNLFAKKSAMETSKSGLNFLKFGYLSLLITIAEIIYFLPNQFSKYFIKQKIKKPAFWGTVRFGLLYFIFPIYIAGLAFIASLFSKIAVLIVLILFPLLVFLGLTSKSWLHDESGNGV